MLQKFLYEPLRGGLGKAVLPVRYSKLYSGEILFYFMSLVVIMIPHRKDGGREGKSIGGIALQDQ